MKLTMLGTSHGVPAKERYCTTHMIEEDGNIYIFDGGAPVIDLLLREDKDLTKVKAFFLSHDHGDHLYGAVSMFALFDWYYKKTNMDVYMPDEIGIKLLTEFINVTDSCTLPNERVRFTVIKEGVIYDDGVIRVTAYPTAHMRKPELLSYAFRIESLKDGKSILYTGDLSPSAEDFPKVGFEEHNDIIICEGAHQRLEVIFGCMDKVKTDNLVVSHVFPLEKLDAIEEKAKEYSFKTIIAEDGDVVEI